jgi:hypothetical protein
MFKTASSKNNELFCLGHNHFIIFFMTLFSLLFVFTTYIYSEEIYIVLQRKFVVPHLEKKFGFRGKRDKIEFDKQEYETFTIESVEPGSFFELAGFKPGDMPRYYGCRFLVIGKTNEAMFYSQLNSIQERSISTFSVSNIDDYRKYLKANLNADLPERKVFLTTEYPKCLNSQ